MSWYRTGTVALTNGNAAVTGTSTAWLTNVNPGEGFLAPDGKPYEVQSVNSDTSITLASNYAGTTTSGAAYAILPTQSFIQTLANQVAALIATYQDIAAAAGDGKFVDGSLAAPGIAFVDDTNTGIRRTASGTFELVSDGVAVAEINGQGIEVKGMTHAAVGALATTTGGVTIDWTASHAYVQAEPTGNITYTFTAPNGPCHLQLVIDSDGTNTAVTFTWPGTVIWFGSSWTATDNKKAIINFWYDGTNYLAMGVSEA